MATLQGIVDKIMALDIPGWSGWVFLAIVIGLAVWLFFRPIETN